jgi:uncharacterized protein (TIGR03382 family)
MHLVKPLAAVAALSLVSGAHASLLVMGPGTQVIDLQSDVGVDGSPGNTPDDLNRANDVFSFKTQGNFRNLLEHDTSAWQNGSNFGSFGFSAEAWTWKAGTLNVGNGAGNRTLFSDFNDDGDLADELNVINAVRYTELSTIGLGVAGDFASDIGNTARPFRSYDLTLRVQNVSGSTIDAWSFGLDHWYADDDDTNAVASILWSTDNVNFNTIDSVTTTNTGAADAFVEADLDGSFTAAVADGEFLYLRFDNARVGGSGSGARTVIDNFTVTAIPEPASAGLAALAGLGLLGRRRRA